MKKQAATATKKAPVRRAAAAKAATVAKRPARPAGPKPERKVITVQADPGSTVFLAGSFNNWDPAALRMVDKAGNGVYSATVALLPGIYEYKFVINGVWTLDPDPDRDWTQNGLGTLNSVLRV